MGYSTHIDILVEGAASTAGLNEKMSRCKGYCALVADEAGHLESMLQPTAKATTSKRGFAVAGKSGDSGSPAMANFLKMFQADPIASTFKSAHAKVEIQRPNFQLFVALQTGIVKSVFTKLRCFPPINTTHCELLRICFCFWQVVVCHLCVCSGVAKHWVSILACYGCVSSFNRRNMKVCDGVGL